MPLFTGTIGLAKELLAWEDCSCLCFTASNAKFSESRPGAISSTSELQVLYLQMSKQQLETVSRISCMGSLSKRNAVRLDLGTPSNCIPRLAMILSSFRGSLGKSSSRNGTSPEVPSIRNNVIMNDRGSLTDAVNWPCLDDRTKFFPFFA